MKYIIVIAVLLIPLIPSVTTYERVEPPPPVPVPAQTIDATVYAYTSEVGQTDDTPHLTASGKMVRLGIVANNCLPFGTKVVIAGDIYTVEDRMNSRYGCEHFDVWMMEKSKAIIWGVKELAVSVLK